MSDDDGTEIAYIQRTKTIHYGSIEEQERRRVAMEGAGTGSLSSEAIKAGMAAGNINISSGGSLYQQNDPSVLPLESWVHLHCYLMNTIALFFCLLLGEIMDLEPDSDSKLELLEEFERRKRVRDGLVFYVESSTLSDQHHFVSFRKPHNVFVYKPVYYVGKTFLWVNILHFGLNCIFSLRRKDRVVDVDKTDLVVIVSHEHNYFPTW